MGLLTSIKENLRIYHRNNPNSLKGEWIWQLYNAYWKIRWRLQNRILRMNDEIKIRNLILSVEYVYVAEVEGDIVEFGTMTGETACRIASGMVAFSKKLKKISKNLYLLDSFVGLPTTKSLVDKGNPHVVSGMWEQGSLMGLNPQQLIAKIYGMGLAKDKIKVYAGWFCDTLPSLPDDTKFGMLHIDCDLYQSTVDVLDVCFSRGLIAWGAIVLFDDWNLAMASPTLGERRAWLDMVEKYSVVYSDEGGYGWSGHKFIVYSYRN